jgi:hypothetical protein
LLDPIVLFEKRILDGRNRAAACESAGIAPRYVAFEGTREEALMFVVSHNLKRRQLTKLAIADTLVEAEDFNLHYELGEPGAQSDIKMSAQKPKTASSRELARAAGGAVSREMINATRKVKEKAEPELQDAVKKGRIGVKMLPRRPICRPSNKRPLPRRQNQGEPRRRPPKRPRTPPRALPAVTGTRAPRFARLGKRPPPCAAYGKRPTTGPGNGLWAWFGSISMRPTTASGAPLNPWTNRRTRPRMRPPANHQIIGPKWPAWGALPATGRGLIDFGGDSCPAR